MALRVRAGSSIRFQIHLQNRDTLAPFGGVPVFLDLITEAAAAPQALAGGETDAQGNAELAATVPTAPGTYRYRARTPGLANRVRPDTSTAITIDAVAL